MRIIRFLDDSGRIQYGHNYLKDSAQLLSGGLFGKRRDRGDRVRVKKLLAPLAPPAILCIGLNYRPHVGEFGAEIPRYPILFMKNPAALTNPGDPIILPPSCLEPPQVDFETELAVVIGRAAKDVEAKDALDYVLGYTIGNDVSARSWQKNGGGGQWVRGKSFDTFCPLGPMLVTTDEIPDPQNLQLSCFLNSVLMQKASTSEMIFPVRELIAYLSSSTTLLPGTVIMTGTPGGVGFVRQPPVFLQPGDRLEMMIEKIGVLSNPVIAGVRS